MLTEKEALVYGYLWKHEDRPTVIALAGILGINRMAISRALARLEKLGAIRGERMERRHNQIIMSTVEVLLSPEELREKLFRQSPLADLVKT